MFEFIETSYFSRHREKYMDDDQFREFQSTLAKDPSVGDVMPGCGGARKMRWADPRRGKGKRGGLRIIYYFASSDGQIWLLTLFDKSEMKDLDARQQLEMKALIQAIKAEG